MLRPAAPLAVGALVPPIEVAFEILCRELDALAPCDFIDWPDRGACHGTWRAFPLFFHTYPEGLEAHFAPNQARCPESTRVLRSIPRVVSAGFSWMEPGCHVLPHTDSKPENLLRTRLGLRVPPGAVMRVGADRHEWNAGRCLIFDGAIEHETANLGVEPRVVRARRRVPRRGRARVSALDGAAGRSTAGSMSARARLAAMRNLWWTVVLAGCAAVPDAPPTTLALPPRAADAPAGSAMVARLDGLSLAERERIVEREVVGGNVPAFLRELVPVELAMTIDGRVRSLVLFVAPDYLAVGDDADFFRVPLTPATAQRIADATGCVLPTRRIVDAIHHAATVKLAPRPFHPDEHDITAIATFAASHAAIETARAGRTGLVSGIKKDVVLSAQLAERDGRVFIYGWHRPDGTPIQPLWGGHTTAHVDYSHGIRLVARRVLLDGVPRDLTDLLADPALWPLVSDEGPLPRDGY